MALLKDTSSQEKDLDNLLFYTQRQDLLQSRP